MKQRPSLRRLSRFAASQRKRKRSRGARLSNVLKHPAMLLVLGFVFTGILGTLLNIWAQDRQQNYTNQQELAKTNLDVMESTLESAARIIAANQDVVMAEDWEWEEKEFQRRVETWHRETARWQVEEKLNRARLKVRLQCTAIHESFDAISADIDALTVNVSSMVTNRKATDGATQKDANDAYFAAKKQIDDFRKKDGKLNGLATLILREIEDPQGTKKLRGCSSKAE